MEGSTSVNLTREETGSYMVANLRSLPVIVGGHGAEVEDEEGNTYLDLEAGPGVVGVGHCHPAVVAAVQSQAARLMQSPGRFHSRLAFDLARRISLLTGNRLNRVFFANSGAEANDGATKLAMKYAMANKKQGFGIVALEHGFHGRLSLTLSLTGLPNYKKGFGPYASTSDIVHIAAPYVYRCPFGSSTPLECGNRCVEALREVVRSRPRGSIAMMIAEPILGVSGVLVPPDNYWPQVSDICANEGIVLVIDEVFMGFGRTGKPFAHQHWNTNPSIVTFAKAIGGGVPLGGFVATAEVADAFDAWDHNTTFGANNQIGLAAGHAVLDVIGREDLIRRAEICGERLMTGLTRLQEEHVFVGDVRGMGLAIGVEIVKDRASKEPAPELAKQLQARLLESGSIIGVGGVYGNVLRLSPPLTLTDNQIDHALHLLEHAFAATP